jgi:hypothetical protein
MKDRSFTRILLDEALALLRDGKSRTARLVLRDLVDATVGFERLAVVTKRPAGSLQRMLDARANPRMDDLALILRVLAGNDSSAFENRRQR